MYPSEYVDGIDDNVMTDDNHASELLALLSSMPVSEPPSWGLLCVSILALAGWHQLAIRFRLRRRH
jgi:hypothetical protein